MARVKNRKNQKFGYSMAIEAILKYIVDNGYVNDDLLPSLKDMADMLFDGKLKQVRMAVAQLASVGVLESHRGRGVFVKNAALAAQMSVGSREAPQEPSISDFGYEMEMPHILQEMPRITLTMVEHEPLYSRVWGEIVDAFNAVNHDFQVDINYTVSPNVGMESDLFQIQSFRIRPYIEQGMACELSGHINEMDTFHPNLYGEVRRGNKVYGIPVTAAVYAMIANDQACEANGLSPSAGWDSFDDFMAYLKSTRAVLKEKQGKTSVISSCFVLGYYMALAGILKKGERVEQLDLNRPDVQAFLERFGELFNDSVCFNQQHDSTDYTGNLIVEASSYSLPPAKVGTPPVSRYLPLPVNPGGYCPLISHYICVSNRSEHQDFALQFLDFLSSKQVSGHLVQRGLISGRTDTGLDPALITYFDNGCPEGWRDEQEARMSKVANHVFSRWQSGQISLSQALEMIERARKGKSGKVLLLATD